MICSACREENPDRAKFCLECGASVISATELGREERKVVTVLFCDLVGFTSRAEAMDVEDVRGTLRTYHRLLRGELESFGGTVEKFIGDAAMALFGAPVAHEDDPERAVRAAFAIVDVLEQLRDSDLGVDLHVRIGISTGEALIVLAADPTRGEGMASGDVINTAARLQSAAPTDGILVGERTYRATRRVIDYQGNDPVVAKGKADPVPAWTALQPRGRFGTNLRHASHWPLVGREDEIELLWSAFGRCRREREPQLVTILGVPGIGKSRLVWELLSRVHADRNPTIWRQGRCLPYGEGVAYWALGEIVKAETGILESDPLKLSLQKLRRSVAGRISDPHEADWVSRHLERLVGGDAADPIGGIAAFAAWRRFLEAIADEHPLVLAFEDIHWADEGLLDFIDYLWEWATGHPMLILCTTRPELLDRRTGWGGGKPNAFTIALAPLSNGDIAQIVADRLRQPAIATDMQNALVMRAEGNPLYAEEYVGMLIDRGFLARERGVWRLANVALPLPETIHALISARLDTLGADEKSLLQDAAVVGKVFWLGAVQALSGYPRWHVEELLHHLEGRDLIRRQRQSSVASETEYTFQHILTRDITYEQLPRPERVRRHRNAAEWIESLAGDRHDQLDALAHHYLTAATNAKACGAIDSDFERRAAMTLQQAGERELVLGAFDRAEQLLRAALGLTSADDSRRPYLLLDVGWADRRFDQPELGQAFEQLLQRGDIGAAAWAESLLGSKKKQHGSVDEGWRLLEGAWERVRSQPPTVAKARVLENLVSQMMMASRYAGIEPLAEEALELATKQGLLSQRVAALCVLGMAGSVRGDPGCFDSLTQAVALARERRIPTSAPLANNATAYEQFGDLRSAVPLIEEGLRDAKRLGDRFQTDRLTVERAWLAFHAGDWSVVEALIAPLLARAGGSWYLDSTTRALAARLHLARGDLSAALEMADGALRGARRHEDPRVLCEALTLTARMKTAVGAYDAAASRVTEALALEEPSQIRHVAYLISADLAHVGRAIAHVRPRVVDALRPACENPWARAALAYLDGAYREAGDRYETIGALPDSAEARARAGEQLQSDGEPGAAKDQLDQAAVFWRKVGATGYLRELEGVGELRSVGSQPS